MFRIPSAFLLAVVGGLVLGAQTGNPPAAEDPKPPPAQPIPFSHKMHARVGLACKDCHAMKDPGFAAGYPEEEKCMLCHASIKADSPAIQKLAAFAKQGSPIPWVKIYRVPDYVYFSHAFHHVDAEIDCARCHGPVAERDVIAKEKPTSMVACMACHDETGASNECNLCHDAQ